MNPGLGKEPPHSRLSAQGFEKVLIARLIVNCEISLKLKT